MKNPALSLLLIAFYLVVSAPAWAGQAPADMVLIKGGCFKMGTDKVYEYLGGSPDAPERPNDRERPVHKVCLDSYYLDTHETTQEKWDKMMEHNNSVHKGPDIAVNQLDWAEARKFCIQQGHRLPTEAEWEYAARSGKNTAYPWGDEIDTDYVWFAKNSGHTHHPVGTRKPNAWGLYDMLGGVWEWVEDWYGEFYYKDSPVKNPQGPSHLLSWHVIRGGSWVDEKEFIRTTIRYPGMADNTEDFWVGVRCAHDAS
ncbi:MAG: SUMF1/EgtB/PvdO family nonheme iron enzyme [Nitrospinae bacterium]|nr:SUMF1/EgtB/PvdO family nonheme iron enzyme [Nitrospinota bacterium]